MAITQTVSDSYGTYYYIDSSSSKDVLTWEQMCENAKYFYSYTSANFPEWSLNAVCAMLGNFRYEGAMNPSQWEYGKNKSTSYGYGLGQWTPATKLLEWLTENGYLSYSMPGQIQRIEWEAKNNAQWISTTAYPLTFEEFLASELPCDTLASYWLYDWERPKDPAATEQYRKDAALSFYELLSGETSEPPAPPSPPEPEPSENRPMKVWMYHRSFIE